MTTKEKIITATIQLFNEHGLANVRLQQIAKETDISVGNLAYHFRNKEAIVEAVVERLEEEVSNILANYRRYPNLMDFDFQLSKYFSFISDYPFYFLDLLEIERTFPQIHTNRQHHTAKMAHQFRKRFDFNEQRGILKEEPREGIYDSIANTILITITFYTPQNMIRGNGQVHESSFKEAVWNLMYPYFTDDGIAEFKQLIEPILRE
ncbi:MAG: TetR/AcrR family transcriptional regulator [Bacteroidota bacterium]